MRVVVFSLMVVLSVSGCLQAKVVNLTQPQAYKTVVCSTAQSALFFETLKEKCVKKVSVSLKNRKQAASDKFKKHLYERDFMKSMQFCLSSGLELDARCSNTFDSSCYIAGKPMPCKYLSGKKAEFEVRKNPLNY